MWTDTSFTDHNFRLVKWGRGEKKNAVNSNVQSLSSGADILMFD